MKRNITAETLPSDGKFKKAIKFSFALLKGTIKEFGEDKVLNQSAALSYYTIFSIAPLLIIIIKLCSIFYGQDAIEGKIFTQIGGYVGIEAAKQIQDALRSVHTSGDSFVATIIGIVTLILGATGIFGEIQDSINVIWNIRPKPKRGWVKLIINRLLSFSLIISLGFLLLVTLVINGILDTLSERLQKILPELSMYTFSILNLVVMFSVITLLFGTIFKVLPDAKIKWRDVLAGSVFTAVLFMLGKYVLTWYLSHNASVSAYGAAGSIILILLWVYYSSTILFLGAEFTQVYARLSNRQIRPNQYSVFVESHEVETKKPLNEKQILHERTE